MSIKTFICSGCENAKPRLAKTTDPEIKPGCPKCQRTIWASLVRVSLSKELTALPLMLTPATLSQTKVYHCYDGMLLTEWSLIRSECPLTADLKGISNAKTPRLLTVEEETEAHGHFVERLKVSRSFFKNDLIDSILYGGLKGLPAKTAVENLSAKVLRANLSSPKINKPPSWLGDNLKNYLDTMALHHSTLNSLFNFTDSNAYSSDKQECQEADAVFSVLRRHNKTFALLDTKPTEKSQITKSQSTKSQSTKFQSIESQTAKSQPTKSQTPGLKKISKTIVYSSVNPEKGITLHVKTVDKSSVKTEIWDKQVMAETEISSDDWTCASVLKSELERRRARMTCNASSLLKDVVRRGKSQVVNFGTPFTPWDREISSSKFSAVRSPILIFNDAKETRSVFLDEQKSCSSFPVSNPAAFFSFLDLTILNFCDMEIL